MKEKEQVGQKTGLGAKKEQAFAETAQEIDKPLDDKTKKKIVRMIVNYTQQDKIIKAMQSLKEQGMGENEVKITLEE